MNQSMLLEKAREIYEHDDAENILESLGVSMSRTVSESSSNNGGWFRYVYSWHLPAPVPFRAKFVRNDLFRKLLNAFQSKVKVGDPLFDDNVSFLTSDAEKCLITLSERCQGGIMAFTRLGTVEIDSNEITIKFATQTPSMTEVPEQVVIVSHFLQWVL